MDDPRERILVDQRPWGRFERITHNENSTVKLIYVSPDQTLSLQRHRLRDELWTILSGTATVQVGDARVTAGPGERFFIPRGALHRLGAAGPEPVQMLEVAFGTFDEDDIERLEDKYER